MVCGFGPGMSKAIVCAPGRALERVIASARLQWLRSQGPSALSDAFTVIGTTVVVSDDALFAGFASGSLPVTATAFVSTPGARGVTVTWTVTGAPGASAPSPHVTPPANDAQPGEALTSTVPGGTASVRVTPV